MRMIVAVLLIGEAASTAMWIARILPVLAIYGGVVMVFVGLRAAVAALQCAAGLMALQRRPPAVFFAQWSLLLSAALLTLELGVGVTPTSVFPSYRWPIVGGYWVYVLLVVWALSKTGWSLPRRESV